MNKLFGASVLVLGLAMTQVAFAGDENSADAKKGSSAFSSQISANTLLSDNNGNVSLAFETNKAVSKATLENTSIFNVAKQDVYKGNGTFATEASLGQSGNSGWSGMSQVNVTAGQNNAAELNQQVTANIRSLINQ